MNDERDRLVSSIHIEATKEAVWAELTRTDGPQAAMWNTVLHSTGLAPGSAYQMRTPTGRHVNVVGEVLEWDPPTLLRQTVRFVRIDEPPCIVTHEITDAPDGGVMLTLTVDGAPPDTMTRKTFESAGLSWICGTVKHVVEGGRAPLSTRAMYRVFDLLPFLGVNAAMKVEHWPLEAT